MQTDPCQQVDIRSSTHGGRRGIRLPGRVGLGYALVMESCHRPSVAAAGSEETTLREMVAAKCMRPHDPDISGEINPPITHLKGNYHEHYH